MLEAAIVWLGRRREIHRSRAAPTKIISVTIPKSGTLFLSNSFTGGLGLPDMQPSPGYVLHDYLDEWRL